MTGEDWKIITRMQQEMYDLAADLYAQVIRLEARIATLEIRNAEP